MSNEVKSGILEKKGQKYFPVTDVSLVQGLQDLLSGKQEALVSGENIKTVNNQSLLGSGNITIQGGSGVTELFIAEYDVTPLADVLAAYNAGKLVVVDDGNGYYYMPYAFGDSYATFFTVSSEDRIVTTIEVTSDGWESNEFTLFDGNYVNLYNTPTIPAALSDLSSDSTHRLVTDTEKATWNGKYEKPANGIPASDIAAGVIPDVSQFVTKSVNDLANYYLKSETYTKDEVAALIGAIQQFHYEIYASLPASGESNVLYLIGPTGSGTDKYEEYVYASGSFVKIGDTGISLAGYVTTQELNAALANYWPKADVVNITLSDLAVSGDWDDIENNPIPEPSASDNGKVLGVTNAQGTLGWVQSGGVTSVGLSVPTCLQVTGSPITSSGTLAVTFKTGYSIPTDAKQSGWDAKYDKPSGGIPKTDLASGVQTSLEKADSALQSFTESDPVFTASTAAGITASDITAWNGKYTKPASGIPASDLADGVIQTQVELTTSIINTLWEES